ncbi:DUF2076 family protein [Phenylobacterium sp.]|uniref:DUF2076 family protein n=1 Tax=Phenylobacterium sp. TaxID=1871053 RepID=UPI00122AB859|nr:DUF2076 family protein [Phenylobacterium sp.]THD61460.1 MAG: DUF2076 family protein [Phenylobacterium sp.]
MTPDERAILQSFLSDLAQTPIVTKDAEAAAMIEDTIRANPNAAYLLVQHVILADQALHAAQAQLAAQGGASSSFLAPQASPPPAPAPRPNVWGDPGGTIGQPAGYGAGPWAGQGGGPVQSSPFAANSGLGGFLRNAGQMAVGVAAGDFLFQGIENIFSPRW